MENHSDSDGGSSDFEVITPSSHRVYEKHEDHSETSEQNFGALTDNLESLASFSDEMARGETNSKKKWSTCTLSENLSSQYSNSQVSTSSSESQTSELKVQLDKALAEIEQIKMEKNVLESVIDNMNTRLCEMISSTKEQKSPPPSAAEVCIPSSCCYTMPCHPSKMWISLLVLSLSVNTALIMNDNTRREITLSREREATAQRNLEIQIERQNQRSADWKKRESQLKKEISSMKESISQAEESLKKMEVSVMKEIEEHINRLTEEATKAAEKHRKEKMELEELLFNSMRHLDEANYVIQKLKDFAESSSYHAHDRYGFDKPFKECMEILPDEKLCRLLADGLEYQAEEVNKRVDRYLSVPLEM